MHFDDSMFDICTESFEHKLGLSSAKLWSTLVNIFFYQIYVKKKLSFVKESAVPL